GAYAAPEQAADIVCPHIFPMLHIPAGKPGLRVPAVVVLESPVPHGGVGKAPASQFFHGVKVSAPLFSGFPFLAADSLAVALWRVAVWTEYSGLIRRKIGCFRLSALAEVQYTVLAGVALRLRDGGCYILKNRVDFILHNLSPALHE